MTTHRPAKPGIQYDRLGRLVPARSSGVHCKVCGIVFALGYLPVDGSQTCRECRADPRPAPPPPSLFDDDTPPHHREAAPALAYDAGTATVPD